MNLVQITDHWYPDKIGGSCKYAFELAHILSGLGEFATLTITGKDHVEESEIEVGKPLSKLNYLRNHREIFAFLKERRPAAVLLHSPLMYLYTARAAKQLGIPLIAIFHGPWGMEAGHKYRNGRGLKAWVLSRLTFVLTYLDQLYLRKVDRVVFLSRYMKSQAEKITAVEKKSDVIPYWTASEVCEEAEKETLPPFKLLVLRRLEFRMGVQSLLDAIARAPNGTQLVVVGTGTYEYALRDRAEELGISEQVHFAGRVSEEDKLRHLSQADLMVLPSSDLEGFGIVVLEALEAGLPVICREGVGFLDFYTEQMHGAIFRYETEDELVRLLSAPVKTCIDPDAFSAFSIEAVVARFKQAVEASKS